MIIIYIYIIYIFIYIIHYLIIIRLLLDHCILDFSFFFSTPTRSNSSPACLIIPEKLRQFFFDVSTRTSPSLFDRGFWADSRSIAPLLPPTPPPRPRDGPGRCRSWRITGCPPTPSRPPSARRWARAASSPSTRPCPPLRPTLGTRPQNLDPGPKEGGGGGERGSGPFYVWSRGFCMFFFIQNEGFFHAHAHNLSPALFV